MRQEGQSIAATVPVAEARVQQLQFQLQKREYSSQSSSCRRKSAAATVPVAEGKTIGDTVPVAERKITAATVPVAEVQESD